MFIYHSSDLYIYLKRLGREKKNREEFEGSWVWSDVKFLQPPNQSSTDGCSCHYYSCRIQSDSPFNFFVFLFSLFLKLKGSYFWIDNRNPPRMRNLFHHRLCTEKQLLEKFSRRVGRHAVQSGKREKGERSGGRNGFRHEKKDKFLHLIYYLSGRGTSRREVNKRKIKRIQRFFLMTYQTFFCNSGYGG